ncbi:transposase [Streptomyces sp. NPDC001219]
MNRVVTDTRRGDLTDAEWERPRPFLPVTNRRCGLRRDHRQVIDRILHRVATGVQWRDLPERFGPWITTVANVNDVTQTLALLDGIPPSGAAGVRPATDATVSRPRRSLPKYRCRANGPSTRGWPTPPTDGHKGGSADGGCRGATLAPYRPSAPSTGTLRRTTIP